MLIAVIGLGVAVLLVYLPGAFRSSGVQQSGLHNRIEIEQNARFTDSFAKNGWKLPGLSLLTRNPHVMERLIRYVGVDKQQVSASLARLRWKTTLEEIVLAKLFGALLVLAALIYLYFAFQMGQNISYDQLLPLIAALVAFLLPTQYLEWADKKAKQEIQQQIPVFFSIVQALVEAGMPIHSAVKATARRDPSRLGRELAWMDVEERQYGNWRKALEETAYRWEVDGFVAIALEINEALTKGISISKLLADQVEEQLRQQESEAEAGINRLQVRLLPFLIVFMGIPLMFLVMGPAFMGIGEKL
ncbi:UNVERIFIED_CONTAM: tight adherence protein C [Brevibacillus sp. OAP136]